MFEGMAPRDLYAMLERHEADIMLSGGRTQFIALKARMPWLDINQERLHPYAGYDGMVEMVRQIDFAIRNPIWAQVREPAPFDADGRIVGESVVSRRAARGEMDEAPRARRTADDEHHPAHTLKKFAGAGAGDADDC